MRPRLLTDEMIAGAIRDLAARGRVTGVAVRALLLQRYGAKGSVSRVYRLMGASREPMPAPRRGLTTMDDPRCAAEALERAALAEERERAHQSRWARETDALRVQLADAQQGAREVHDLRLRVAQLRQALAAAQARVVHLEQSVVKSR
jgi:hypothetical protein